MVSDFDQKTFYLQLWDNPDISEVDAVLEIPPLITNKIFGQHEEKEE